MEFSKEVKNLLNYTNFKECGSQKFVVTVLVTCVTILAEPDVPLKDYVPASQHDFCSMF